MSFSIFNEKKIFKKHINLKQLKESLEFNPLTGNFSWKVSPCNRIQIGDIAGSIDKNGYIIVRINKKAYYAHRLAWFYYYEEWPNKDIDHRDLNKINNKIKNLRLATKPQNAYNTAISKRNTSGFKGVSQNKITKRWMAQLIFEGERIYLGYFSTPEEAYKVYTRTAKKLHGKFFRLK